MEWAYTRIGFYLFSSLSLSLSVGVILERCLFKIKDYRIEWVYGTSYHLIWIRSTILIFFQWHILAPSRKYGENIACISFCKKKNICNRFQFFVVGEYIMIHIHPILFFFVIVISFVTTISCPLTRCINFRFGKYFHSKYTSGILFYLTVKGVKYLR